MLNKFDLIADKHLFGLRHDYRFMYVMYCVQIILMDLKFCFLSEANVEERDQSYPSKNLVKYHLTWAIS